MHTQPTKHLALAIEGGGSKTNFALIDQSGEVLLRAHAGPSSKLYLDNPEIVRLLVQALEQIEVKCMQENASIVRVIASGPIGTEELSTLVAKTIKSPEYKFEHLPEYVVSLAVHQREFGIGLVAGTGSSCCGRSPSKRVECCGGYGPQFGDEGSGYWIGRAAIAAVMKAEEGRAPATVLQANFYREFSAPSLWDLLRRTDANGHIAVQQVAGFARFVFAAAQAGDAVALSICEQAGHALAALVIDVAQRLNFDGQAIPLSRTGGVFHAGALICEPMNRALAKHDYAFELLPIAPDPMDGVIHLIKQSMHTA